MANGNMKVTLEGAPEHFDALGPILAGGNTLADLAPDIEGKATKAIATPVLPGLNGPLSLKSAMPPVTVTPSAGPSMARSILSPITSDASVAPAAAPHRSVMSRIGGVLGKIGEAAGNVLAPEAMSVIPGTQLNKQWKAGMEQRAAQSGATVAETEARTGELKAETEAKGREYSAPKMGTNGYMLLNKDSGQYEFHEYPKGKPETLTQAEADLLGMDPSTPEYKQKLKMIGDIHEQIAKEHPVRPTEAETPLGDKVPQLNAMLTRRYQVQHPGEDLPADYTLPADATQKHLDNIDKIMQQTEGAATTAVQRQTLNEMRKQTMELAQQRAADAQSARETAKADREEKEGLKWVTYTDPKSGATLAGPLSEAKAAKASDMAELQGSDVKEIRDARLVVKSITKQGDTPESQGILQLIDGLGKDKKLGVASSRLNKFMTQGVGAEPGDDPRIIALLDKGQLALTLAMKAHFGASGGRSPAMLQHFLDLANTGKMNDKTLADGFKAVNDYMRDRGYLPKESGVTVTGTQAGPPTISSQAEYDKLPVGADYISNGKPHRKK